MIFNNNHHRSRSSNTNIEIMTHINDKFVVNGYTLLVYYCFLAAVRGIRVKQN